MSTIARGFTFSTGTPDQVSAVSLESLVINAVVTAIPVSEFSSNVRVLQVASSIPASNQGDGSLWFDTTLMILRTKNGDRWDANAVGPEMVNGSGATIAAGTLLVASGDNQVSACLTAAWPEAIGVAVSLMNPSATGVVRKAGIGLAALAGPCTVGDTLIAAGAYTSWSSGRLRSAREAGSTTVTAGIDVGMSLSQVGITTALATCLLWK